MHEDVKRGVFAGRRLRDGSTIYWWVEILAILAFYLVYSAIRNANEGGATEAFHNAEALIDLQRHMGIFVEETLQDWAQSFRPVIIAMNYFYGSGHFVVTAGVGIYLFVRWSDDYPLWRNTLAITTSVALIGFVLWPLMPPRLLDTVGAASYGFADTLAQYPTFWSFNSGAVAEVSNQYAAMPSVHVAWALWCTVAMYPRVRRWWVKALFVAYPVMTIIAIVLTGNHYILDAAGGALVLLIGYGVARVVTRAGRKPVVSGSMLQPDST